MKAALDMGFVTPAFVAIWHGGLEIEWTRTKPGPGVPPSRLGPEPVGGQPASSEIGWSPTVGSPAPNSRIGMIRTGDTHKGEKNA